MKLLTLVRHAKSDWDNDLSDFERPLNNRGMRDAPMMGKIASKNLPDTNLIISSPAVRAKTTAFFFADFLNYSRDNIQLIQNLYLSGISEYIEVLEGIPNDIQHIYLFSHNPGTTNFVNFLCNERLFNIPTCGISHIELNIESWENITRDSGILKHYLTPKSYK